MSCKLNLDFSDSQYTVSHLESQLQEVRQFLANEKADLPKVSTPHALNLVIGAALKACTRTSAMLTLYAAHLL